MVEIPAAFRKEIVFDKVKPIASYNPGRKLIFFWNNSRYYVYVSTEPTNVKEEGIILYPGEGVVFDAADADPTEGAFYAVCDSEEGCEVRVYESIVT